MKPMMTRKEVVEIERILLSIPNGNVLDILEWGSGGSTVYFTNFLQEHDRDYTWTSIEYNKKWYEKVSEAVKADSHVDVVLFDVGNTKLKQRKVPMNGYVNFPAVLGVKFDFILVDGRKRRRCLNEAAKLVRDDGYVVLHDAQREYYHCAFEQYKYGEFRAHKLWVGNHGVLSTRSIPDVHRSSILRHGINPSP